MKTNKIIAIALLLPNLMWAHGSVAEQANNAITTAIGMFASQPKEIQKEFYSIQATKTAYERFTVSILLKNKTTQFNFDCMEDESAEPVIWECTAL